MTSMTLRMAAMVELIALPCADAIEATEAQLTTVSALVEDADDMAYLTNQCRLVGVRDERSQTMRLLFEELVIGLQQGFISLKRQAEDAAESADVKPFIEALMAIANGQRISSSKHVLRLRVYQDLWTKGYFIARGSKFAADFLIYEADPTRSHATALVVVKEHDAPFPAVDIVSHSRVGSMVKKQVFFVSVDPASDQVVYIALNHARLMTRQDI